MNHGKKRLKMCMALLLVIALTITSFNIMPDQVNAQTQN